MKQLAALVLLAGSVFGQTTIRYWAGEHEKSVLADWAMQAWAEGSSGLLRIQKVDTADEAEIRFRWVNPQRRGLYGQSYTTNRDGKRISEVVINPSIESLGPDMSGAVAKDPLYGEVVLFLTCVHEAGHALGPAHTREFADIMYSFEFGGDFVAYFQRYRIKLKSRADIQRFTPLASGDIRQIKDLMSRNKQNEKR
ncbi:MAG: hypothetical protein ABIV50_12460 [Opitutus sp.]